MMPEQLYPLVKIELSIMLSHRNSAALSVRPGTL